MWSGRTEQTVVLQGSESFGFAKECGLNRRFGFVRKFLYGYGNPQMVQLYTIRKNVYCNKKNRCNNIKIIAIIDARY